eukprot:8174690-Pyramimonas_sp.AAC.1
MKKKASHYCARGAHFAKKPSELRGSSNPTVRALRLKSATVPWALIGVSSGPIEFSASNLMNAHKAKTSGRFQALSGRLA